MKKPVAIFYHCLFELGEPPEIKPAAISIIHNQMSVLRDSGLLDEASHFAVGINGAELSLQISRLMIPSKAKIVTHGLQCRSENRTLVEIEKWLTNHPDWYVLYFHAKGATHPVGHSYSDTWRSCMMRHVIKDWRQCVSDLDDGNESVGCHWMTGDQTPPGQSIWAGNFWWATSNFLRTLPSIYERDRIKVSGIDSVESRYESEVWIGNGIRIPRIKDYHGPNWNPSKMNTCAA